MKEFFSWKRATPLVVVASVVFSLAGCRNGGNDNDNDNDNEPVDLVCEEGFSFEAVLSSDNEILHPSVAIAPNGEIWIAFIDLGTVSVSVARGRLGEEFSVEEIEGVSTPLSPPYIVVDSGNTPHVVYRSAQSDSIRHARRNGGWNIDDIPQSGGADYPSIDVASDDTIYVSFFKGDDDTNGQLYIAARSGSDWNVETIKEFGSPGSANSSIRVGSDDVPRISFFDPTDLSLQYGIRSGTSWEFEIVEDALDEFISVGGFNVLALNGSDEPRIAYSFVVSEEAPEKGG